MGENPQINTSDKKVRKKKRKSTSSSPAKTTTPSKKKAKKSPASATEKSPASSKKTTKKSPASATKKVGRPKKATTTSTAASTTATTTSTGIVVDWKIPGVTLDKVRDKVQKIIEGGDKETLTVKSVRTTLEEWLDMDLTAHKDTVRSLTMEFL